MPKGAEREPRGARGREALRVGLPVLAASWSKPALHTMPVGAAEELAVVTELEIEAPTDSQQWLMLGGLLISIVWTMRLIYYHAEPHIWHDAQVGNG
jgi:hypothetical protein